MIEIINILFILVTLLLALINRIFSKLFLLDQCNMNIVSIILFFILYISFVNISINQYIICEIIYNIFFVQYKCIFFDYS